MREKQDFSRMTEYITKAENITFINNEIILHLQSLNLMQILFDIYRAFPQDHKHCLTPVVRGLSGAQNCCCVFGFPPLSPLPPRSTKPHFTMKLPIPRKDQVYLCWNLMGQWSTYSETATL